VARSDNGGVIEQQWASEATSLCRESTAAMGAPTWRSGDHPAASGTSLKATPARRTISPSAWLSASHGTSRTFGEVGHHVPRPIAIARSWTASCGCSLSRPRGRRSSDRCQKLDTDRFTLPKHHTPPTQRELTAVDHTTYNRHPPLLAPRSPEHDQSVRDSVAGTALTHSCGSKTIIMYRCGLQRRCR
jgi:hypothetical protein